MVLMRHATHALYVDNTLLCHGYDADADDSDAGAVAEREYRRANRRSRKSLKDAGRRSDVESVDEMERQLRQFQQRRIAEEIARLRDIHENTDTDSRRTRHRRRCPNCRRRRLGGGRRTSTVSVTSNTGIAPTSTVSLPS